MNSLRKPTALALFALLLAGCGGKPESSDTQSVDADNPLSVLAGAKDIVSSLQDKQEEAAKVLEGRKRRGDTLAMPYKQLQQYLPASVEGYTKEGGPRGETVSAPGMNFSTASQRYVNGADFIEVSIADYNQAYGLWQGLFSFVGMFAIENDQEKMNKFDIGTARTTAVEAYKKQGRDASVTVGTGYRFWIEVKGNNQPGTEFLKQVAKTMPLKTLSDL